VVLITVKPIFLPVLFAHPKERRRAAFLGFCGLHLAMALLAPDLYADWLEALVQMAPTVSGVSCAFPSTVAKIGLAGILLYLRPPMGMARLLAVCLLFSPIAWVGYSMLVVYAYLQSTPKLSGIGIFGLVLLMIPSQLLVDPVGLSPWIYPLGVLALFLGSV
jgi:hypothetical protein